MEVLEFIRKRSKLELGIAIFIVLLIVFAALFAAGVLKFGPGHKTTDHADTGGANIGSSLDAYDAAAATAKGWHSDAVLSSIVSQPVPAGQAINNWRFIFTSPAASGKGYIVDVTGTNVTNAQEVSYSGSAAPLPDNIISQGEAVRRIHAMPGYANQPIIGIQAVYDPIKKVWFWAAKTPIGTVSIEADK